MVLGDSIQSRLYNRGRYDTDFSFMNYGQMFPSYEIRSRNIDYRFRHKQYSNNYGYGKNFIVRQDDIETEIPYKTISLNYYKLVTDKIVDLIFNNEPVVKTGDIEKDKLIYKLMERTGFINSIRKAMKYMTIYGDAGVKVTKNGLSVFRPLNVFRVIDKNDIANTKAYVLYQPIFEKSNGTSLLKYIRFEIHFKGKVFEIVKTFIGNLIGGTVGYGVEYEYNGRKIPADGRWYDTNVEDCELIKMLSINTLSDGVYGESCYTDIQDIVFAMEQRLSIANHTLNNLTSPLMIVGMSMIDYDDNGNYKLRTVNGKFLVQADGDSTKPSSFEQDYKLDNSEHLLEMLSDKLYELSEMSRGFLSGEYKGNIGEETFNNTIKSPIDKGSRYYSENYDNIVDLLYCLCVLNGIEVKRENITLMLSIGRTDSDKKIAEICKELIDTGMFSKSTLREKYYGYSKEQSDKEQDIINRENDMRSVENEMEVKDNED